ncbi:hypothetical protein J6590_020809 [Homalodisca vitripennis]|nr:hypothetical protein J6590_020809 [Homalodisca vitripennis]
MDDDDAEEDEPAETEEEELLKRCSCPCGRRCLIWLPMIAIRQPFPIGSIGPFIRGRMALHPSPSGTCYGRPSSPVY